MQKECVNITAHLRGVYVEGACDRTDEPHLGVGLVEQSPDQGRRPFEDDRRSSRILEVERDHAVLVVDDGEVAGAVPGEVVEYVGHAPTAPSR